MGKVKQWAEETAEKNVDKIIFKLKDGQIDWAHSAEAIHRKLRALSPWPGVFTQMLVEKQKHLKILAAEIRGDHGRPGEIISVDELGVLVGCGKGALRLTQLQRESSRPMQAAEFLNGCPLKTGQILG